MASNSREYLFTVFGGILSALMAGLISFYLSAPESKDIKATTFTEFEQAAVEHLKINGSVDLFSLGLLYEAVTDTPKEALEFRSGFREALLKIHLKLVSGKISDVPQDERSKWTSSFKESISKYDEKSPYHGIHPVEGGIFRDLSSLNTDPKVDEKLKQLAAVVKARFEELESAKKEARWSLIFGVAGVVGAVISIILSLFQALRRANN